MIWKKHKKLFILCTLLIGAIVFLLLGVVWLLEVLQIHLPGSREMWIGLIGALMGGAFTLYGVLITIFKQEEEQATQRRLENMPLLGFAVELREVAEARENGFVMIYDEEMITSGFPMDDALYSVFEIRSANRKPLFNLKISDIYLEGRGVLKKNAAYAPLGCRLIDDEKQRIVVFHAERLWQNLFGAICFTYEDIFGNVYGQDVPFQVYEAEYDGKLRQVIELRDIGQAVFLKEDTRTFEERVKKFVDYREEISETS